MLGKLEQALLWYAEALITVYENQIMLDGKPKTAEFCLNRHASDALAELKGFRKVRTV